MKDQARLHQRGAIGNGVLRMGIRRAAMTHWSCPLEKRFKQPWVRRAGAGEGGLKVYAQTWAEAWSPSCHTKRPLYKYFLNWVRLFRGRDWGWFFPRSLDKLLMHIRCPRMIQRVWEEHVPPVFLSERFHQEAERWQAGRIKSPPSTHSQRRFFLPEEAAQDSTGAQQRSKKERTPHRLNEKKHRDSSILLQ